MEPLSDPLNLLPLVGGLLMWYPSLPVSSKKLAGAAAIPRGEPSGNRSLRLRAGQSHDSGVGALSRRPAISRRPTSNASCVDHLVSSPGTSRVGRLGASSGGKAPMLIIREALEIFAYRCFAYSPLAKYAFLF